MLQYSVPFLAFKKDQMPFPDRQIGNTAAEAILFDRAHLEGEIWETSWKNVADAVKIFGNKNVSFHFPVNESNYCEDTFVHERLVETYKRAGDLGLRGVVAHSNTINLISDWKDLDVSALQKKVADCLNDIVSRNPCESWLALENMPVMDNFVKEIDPLFSFPSDFDILKGTNVSIIWDICHYFNTVSTMKQVLSGEQNPVYYPNIKSEDYYDFAKLNNIVHWHFSAFNGIPNPDDGTICKEGVLPEEGTLDAGLYEKAILEMDLYSSKKQDSTCMVFEIEESNYMTRDNARRAIQWVENVLLKERGEQKSA